MPLAVTMGPNLLSSVVSNVFSDNTNHTYHASYQPQTEEERIADLKRRVKNLLKETENKVCSECRRNKPKFMSLLQTPIDSDRKQLGVFVCKACHEFHLALDDKMRTVKSLKEPEEWTEQDVKTLEYSGNKVVNTIYESALQGKSSDKDRGIVASKHFVEAKYKNCIYFKEEAYHSQMRLRATLIAEVQAKEEPRGPSTTDLVQRALKKQKSKVNLLSDGENEQKPIPRAQSDSMTSRKSSKFSFNNLKSGISILAQSTTTPALSAMQRQEERAKKNAEFEKKNDKHSTGSRAAAAMELMNVVSNSTNTADNKQRRQRRKSGDGDEPFDRRALSGSPPVTNERIPRSQRQRRKAGQSPLDGDSGPGLMRSTTAPSLSIKSWHESAKPANCAAPPERGLAGALARGASGRNLLARSNSQRGLRRTTSGRNLMRDNSDKRLLRDGSNKSLRRTTSGRNLMRDNSNKRLMRDGSNKSLRRTTSGRNLMRDNSNKRLMRDGSNKSLRRTNSRSISGRNLMKDCSDRKLVRDGSDKGLRTANSARNLLRSSAGNKAMVDSSDKRLIKDGSARSLTRPGSTRNILQTSAPKSERDLPRSSSSKRLAGSILSRNLSDKAQDSKVVLRRPRTKKSRSPSRKDTEESSCSVDNLLTKDTSIGENAEIEIIITSNDEEVTTTMRRSKTSDPDLCKPREESAVSAKKALPGFGRSQTSQPAFRRQVTPPTTVRRIDDDDSRKKHKSAFKRSSSVETDLRNMLVGLDDGPANEKANPVLRRRLTPEAEASRRSKRSNSDSRKSRRSAEEIGTRTKVTESGPSTSSGRSRRTSRSPSVSEAGSSAHSRRSMRVPSKSPPPKPSMSPTSGSQSESPSHRSTRKTSSPTREVGASSAERHRSSRRVDLVGEKRRKDRKSVRSLTPTRQGPGFRRAQTVEVKTNGFNGIRKSSTTGGALNRRRGTVNEDLNLESGKNASWGQDGLGRRSIVTRLSTKNCLLDDFNLSDSDDGNLVNFLESPARQLFGGADDNVSTVSSKKSLSSKETGNPRRSGRRRTTLKRTTSGRSLKEVTGGANADVQSSHAPLRRTRSVSGINQSQERSSIMRVSSNPHTEQWSDDDFDGNDKIASTHDGKVDRRNRMIGMQQTKFSSSYKNLLMGLSEKPEDPSEKKQQQTVEMISEEQQQQAVEMEVPEEVSTTNAISRDEKEPDDELDSSSREEKSKDTSPPRRRTSRLLRMNSKEAFCTLSEAKQTRNQE